MALRKSKQMSKNILLFGLAGSTKSSFIGTACTTLEKSEIKRNKAVVGGSADHVTVMIRSWKLKHQGKDYPYRLWDTMGVDFDQKNYSTDMFLRILDGYVTSPIMLEDLGKVTVAKNPQSCILFFIEAKTFQQKGETEPQIEYLKQFYESALKKGFQPIIVLSKADQVKYSPAVNAVNLLYNQIEETVCEYFKISKSNVFPLITYDQTSRIDQRKDFEIDRLASKILLTAFESAENH